jgi:hypothetical protein
VHNTDPGRDHGANSGGTHRKSCVDKRKRKGIEGQVPQLSRGCSWSVYYHISVLGAYWAQAYFDAIPIFGR